ncbi:DUF924 domain-containing protein [Synechococcus sp. CS-1330]|nr:DUF924 domain-containing protein [Synechococcus sp. CS-1330]
MPPSRSIPARTRSRPWRTRWPACRPCSDARPRDKASEVLEFWFAETRPHQWFAKDPSFDQLLQQRFVALTRRAIAGELDEWEAEPLGCTGMPALLALLGPELDLLVAGELFVNKASASALNL